MKIFLHELVCFKGWNHPGKANGYSKSGESEEWGDIYYVTMFIYFILFNPFSNLSKIVEISDDIMTN